MICRQIDIAASGLKRGSFEVLIQQQSDETVLFARPNLSNATLTM